MCIRDRGRGFVASEKKTEEKTPLGTIMLDSAFTPIRKVHFEVENTRVGSITNFDRLTIDITTNGSITPYEALKNASQILIDHFTLINTDLADTMPNEKPAKKKSKTSKTKSKK